MARLLLWPASKTELPETDQRELDDDRVDAMQDVRAAGIPLEVRMFRSRRRWRRVIFRGRA